MLHPPLRVVRAKFGSTVYASALRIVPILRGDCAPTLGRSSLRLASRACASLLDAVLFCLPSSRRLILFSGLVHAALGDDDKALRLLEECSRKPARLGDSFVFK